MTKSIHEKKDTKKTDRTIRRETASAQWPCHVHLFSLVDIIFKGLHLHFPPIGTSRSVVIVQTTRGGKKNKKKHTHDIQNRIILLAAEKYTVSRHHRDELHHNMLSNAALIWCDMNRPAPIRRALWQEAVEPSQSDPFPPPQPQCEVHSPSRNKYGNIQEHRLQSHSMHFYFLHRVGTCRPDSDCRRPGRKKKQKKNAVVSPGRRILRLNTETTSAVFQGAQSFGPLNGSHSAAASPPPHFGPLGSRPTVCVCVCGWVSPLHHAHGQLLFSGSV